LPASPPGRLEPGRVLRLDPLQRRQSTTTAGSESSNLVIPNPTKLAPWESTKLVWISMSVSCRIAPSTITWTSDAEQEIRRLCTAIDPPVSTVQ
jgi:hypothetical protein